MSVTHPSQVTVTNGGVTRSLASDLDSLAPTAATVTPSAPGAVARTVAAKLSDVTSINDFGIGDASATINILEDGRVSQLPWINPFTWFRMDLITGAQAVTALIGEKQEASSIVRTTTGTLVVGGVESTAAAGQLRFQDNPQGLLIEPQRTQFISVPDAPVSQTGIALGTGTPNYYLRVEGSGSIAVALATGSATGLPGTATAGSPLAFKMTVAGTINTTVTGSVTFAQLENGNVPSSRIHTAITRNADAVALAHVPRSGRDWLISVRAQPNGGLDWTPDADGRALFTLGDSISVANVAFAYFGSDGSLRFSVNDSTNTAKLLSGNNDNPGVTHAMRLGGIEHDFWFYNTADGIMEVWIDGERAITSLTGTGTGIITTMPANLRPGIAAGVGLKGVVKDFRIYYDTAPSRIPQPQWTRTITPNTVVCLGDSITFGTAVTTPYPTTLQTNLSAGTTGAWTVVNAGNSGDRTYETIRHWGAGIRRQPFQYVVLFSGTNDPSNTSGITAPTSMRILTRIATQVRTDGKKLLMLTALPRTPFTTAQDAERKRLNVLIRAYCAAGGATLVDTEPVFDNGDGRTLKVAYDSGDGIHPNQAGADLIAAMVAAAIPH